MVAYGNHSGGVRVSEWKDEQGRWNVGGVCACSELKFSGSKLVHYSPPEQHERCPAPRWQRSRERETRQPPPCSVPDIQGSTCSRLAKGEVFRGAPQWPQRGPEIGSSALCPRPTKGWGGGEGGRGGGNTARAWPNRWVAMDHLVLAALPCGPQGARRRIQAGSMVWRTLRSS